LIHGNQIDVVIRHPIFDVDFVHLELRMAFWGGIMRKVLGAAVRIFSACALTSSWSVRADSPPVRMCSEAPSAPSCTAVRGDRSEGWIPQTRSEVMAQHGMVSTVQPLGAMAGARILMQGGNAIDGAVATAAALNVTYPANVGSSRRSCSISSASS
jgi:hypothetical protein